MSRDSGSRFEVEGREARAKACVRIVATDKIIITYGDKDQKNLGTRKTA